MENGLERIPNESLKQYKLRLFRNKTKYDLTTQRIADLINKENEQNYNESTYRKWYRAYEEGYNDSKQEDNISDSYTRILAVSDFHIPFNLDIDIFKNYKNKVDILVINGDLMDCYSLSKFTKMYRKPLIDELVKAREYVMDLVDYIKPQKVIAITGNHEIRLGRVIANKIGTDLLDLLPSDAMAFIFDTGFNHHDHEKKTKTVYEPLSKVFAKEGIECIYANNFWYQIGKAIFVHPLSFKQSPLSTTVKAYDYFQSKRLNFSTICMAHTHQIGYTKYGAYHLFEQGCCADLGHMDYMDMKLPKVPQSNGFLYLVQDSKGELIYNKSKLEIL